MTYNKGELKGSYVIEEIIERHIDFDSITQSHRVRMRVGSICFYLFYYFCLRCLWMALTSACVIPSHMHHITIEILLCLKQSKILIVVRILLHLSIDLLIVFATNPLTELLCKLQVLLSQIPRQLD